MNINSRKAYTAAGIVLVLIGAIFFIFALNHPEMSFGWPNAVTYTVYILYAVYTVIIFMMPKLKRAGLSACIKLAALFAAIVLIVMSICARNTSDSGNWYLAAAALKIPITISGFICF